MDKCHQLNVSAGVLKCPALVSLLILSVLNDISEGLSTNTKMFTKDTFLFSVILDSQTFVSDLNKDFEISFNPEPTKQPQEMIFSCKTKKRPHPPLVFNNANVTQSIYQKHEGIILDSKLTL